MATTIYKESDTVKGINSLNATYTPVERALYDALQWCFDEVEKSEQKN